MWGIDNPLKVYAYLNLDKYISSEFKLIALMKKSKYLSFPEQSRTKLESISNSGLSISDQKIKSPNNPSQLISAKMITYVK